MKYIRRNRILSAAILFIIIAFSTNLFVSAQTPTPPEETTESLLARAANLFDEAFNLLEQYTPESNAAAKEKFEITRGIFEKLGDKQNLALAFVGLGNVAERQNDNDAALENYNRALPLFREVGNKSFEATIFVSVGLIHSKSGKKQLALESFNNALTIFKNLGAKEREAATLVSIGRVYADLGEKAKALEIYNSALVIQRETGGKEAEALTLLGIGKVYDELGENRKAIEFIGDALAIYRNVGSKFGETLALNNLGTIYAEIGENRKALENFQLILKYYTEIGDRFSEAATLNNIAGVYDNLGEKQKAIETYNEALRIRKMLGDANGTAITLSNLGSIYSDLGENRKAFEHYEQALSIQKSVANKEGEATVLNNIGLVYSNFGEKPKALDFYNRALKIRREISDADGEATTLNNIGSVYADLGEKAKALDFYKRSLTLLETVGDKNSEAKTLNNIGLIYSDLGDRRKSLDYYEKALPILKLIGDKKSEATVLSNIGSVYLALGDGKKSLEFFERSLPLSQSVGDRQSEATTLNNIGRVYDETGDKQKALEFFNRAVPIFKTIGDRRNEAITLTNIGRIYDDLSDKKKALDFYFTSLPLSKAVGDKTGEATTLNNIMHVWNDLKNARLAIFYGKQAINVFQELRSNIKNLDRQTQRTFLSTIERSYRRLADILIENGRIAEAEQVLAMLKEEEYFAYLRRGDDVAKELLGKLSLSPDEQSAFKRYEEIADKITALGKEQGELYAESLTYEAGQFPKQARLDELEKLLSDANKVFNLFLDDLKIKFGEEDKRVASVESDTQALLKELNEPRTVIISTIAGEDNLNLIVTTSDAQRAHTVKIKASELNRLVLEFREAAKNPNVDPRNAGKKLYDVLFPAALQKDLDNIGADTIVWSLDGTLRYAPVAAIWDGQKYIIERYAISIITLASRDKLGAPSADKSKLKVLGVGVSKGGMVENADGTRSEFSVLPAVPKELCSVVNDAAAKCATGGVLEGKSLLDDEFTLTAFRNNLGRFSVIHIASHFSLNAGNETDSYLLLGGAGGERKLSIAQLREQFKTKFVGVDLLTLSACNTAMTAGDKSNGLEIEGFGTFAQKQGAKSVMATLWEVADDSTRILMTDFYRLYESGKISKVEAVRQAQIALLTGKSGANGENKTERSGIRKPNDEKSDQPAFVYNEEKPYEHPYFWSPFILIGNWR